MSRAHRRYLLVEQGIGSAAVNFVFNAAIAWVLFRGREVIPLWGAESIMGDTIATCILLPLISCLIVTPLARRAVRTGRLTPLGWSGVAGTLLARLPRGTMRRGLVLGAACLVVLAPLAWLALVALDVVSLGLRRFVLFKAGFAAVAAVLVTPVIARWVLGEAAPASR